MSDSTRTKLARVLIGLGILAVLWATLHLTSSSLGGAPDEQGFAHRRPYNQVKQAVHSSLPGMLWRAGIGGALIWLGAWLSSKAREEA